MRRTRTKPLPGDAGPHTTIAFIERAIASQWHRKDPQLAIGGMPKQYLGALAGFEVYRVHGAWLRANLDVTFGTGGHGLVHCFIPMDELWVDPIAEPVPSLVFHEAMEFHYMMEENLEYRAAHQRALEDQGRQDGRSLTFETVEAAILKLAPERRGLAAGGGLRDQQLADHPYEALAGDLLESDHAA